MASDSERLLMNLFKSRGFGAFRFRQPSIPVYRRYGSKKSGSSETKTSYVSPTQPVDLFVMGTLRIPKSYIEEYNLKYAYEIEGEYYLDVRVGIEEKKTELSVLRIKERINKKPRFITFCLETNLVPCYVVTYHRGQKTPSEIVSKFEALYLDDQFERRTSCFREDGQYFDGFLLSFIEGYLINSSVWRDKFRIVDIED